MKIQDIDGVKISEILQNYNHPMFERAFQMIEEKNFETVGNTNQHTSTTNGDNCRGVRRTDPSMHEVFEALREY